MEEFDNLPKTRRPRQYTYRGSYRRPGSIPGSFNPAADVLSAIEEVEGKFVKRRKDIDLFEQQAMQRRLNLQKMVDDTKTMDENPFKAQMTQEFSQMIDDLYKADIESFDGDRTGYMEKANNAQKVIGDFQKVVGLLDADVNEYKDKSPAELKKLVLRSQFMGKDGMKREDYLSFLNDPGKMGMRIQNGELIITNNGKDLFNGTRYLNSKKEGYSLVEYADDYEKELTQVSNEAATGLQSLVEASSIEKAVAGGTKVTKEVKNDYIKAVDAFKNNLQNSSKIDALINESTFQRFVDSPDVYSEEKYGKQTKQKIIDYLVSKKFPMYDKVAGTAFGDVKTTEDVGAPMTQYQMAQYKNSQRKIALAEKEFKYEKQLEADNKAEFESGIDFYLNRNLKHAKDMKAAGLFDQDKIKTEKAASKIAGLLSEGSAFSYEAVKNKDGDYIVQDASGEVVTGANTPVGLVDLLNQGTIYAQLNADDASEAAKYVGSKMPDLSKKSNITYDVANFSIPKQQGGGSVIDLTDKEKINNAKQDDIIVLSDGTRIRKK